MEYKKICRTCGHVFCYTDADIAKSKQANGLSALSAIGSMAGVLGGNWMAARANQAEMHNQEAKVLDFDHCPNCRSTNLVSITDEELQKISEQRHNETIKSTVSINTNASVESIIKRIEIFLEEGEWKKAEAYCEQALDLEPENGLLYYYLLLTNNSTVTKTDLYNVDGITEQKNYRLARKYGDANLQITLDEIESGYKACIQEKVEKTKKAIKKELDEKYENAKDKICKSENIKELEDAIVFLKSTNDNPETELLITEGERRKEELEKHRKKQMLRNIIIAVTVILIFSAFLIFLSFEKRKQAEEQEILAKEQKRQENLARYNEGLNAFNNGDYADAFEIFNATEAFEGSKKDTYKMIARFLSEDLSDNSFSTGDIGGAYAYYISMSEEDETDIYLKNLLGENKYIQLYEKLLGTYVSEYGEKITFYPSGKIDTSLFPCRLYKKYNGEVFIAREPDAKYKDYITYWESDFSLLDKKFIIDSDGHKIHYKRE